ncbi:MAG: hypothetical protein E6Q97_02955 [Desulfurellales bacterium]|nr:MAG: hypothetical protein E6Q97_02955 [Desulfurellales bacterium]
MGAWQPRQGHAPQNSPDLERIIALPRRAPVEAHTPLARALVLHQTQKFRRREPIPCNCKATRGYCITELKPAQAWALYEIDRAQGLVGSIQVGAGKTVINVLAPIAIGACRVAVLLVPPNTVDQLVVEYEALAQHFDVPSLITHHPVTIRGTRQNYERLLPHRPVLHVVPYSRLSRPEATRLLTQIGPDLIIADEAHKLSDMTTTTTRRWARQMAATNPPPRFVCYSGSILEKTIKEMAHLMVAALGDQAPLPIDTHELYAWSAAIDPVPMPAPDGALVRLNPDGRFPSTRAALSDRIVHTLGFVATLEPSVDVKLTIRPDESLTTPPELRALISDAVDRKVRPDGEELVEPLERYECALQLASGFYYRWIYPRREPAELIDKWFARRKAWRAELRAFFEESACEHLDSEFLITQAGLRGLGKLAPDPKLPSWQPTQLLPWLEIRDQVQPQTKAVRVSDFFVQHLAQRAAREVQVIWYDQTELGVWLAEVSGLPRHGGGPKAPTEIAKERGTRSIIASIGAHGTGRDGLQYGFHKQYVATPPTGAKLWQQLMGRLHRQGQTRDVYTEYAAHHAVLKQSFESATDRAFFVTEMLRGQHKIL